MQQLLFIIHILVGLAIVALVLMQQGKGAGMGSGFGSGASGTVFGSQGNVSFLFKLTSICAALFFATSLGISVYISHLSSNKPKVVNIGTSKPQVPGLPLNQ